MDTDLTWEEKYKSLCENIRFLHEQAQALRADMVANALSAGSIEAEGYLRACITIFNLIDEA